jgi:hypothetical protein
MPTPIGQYITHPTTSNAPASTTITNHHPTPGVLQFGKYKGRTVEDVYVEDPNYIKWCAENISDPGIKAAAKEIISKPHIQSKSVLSDNTEKQLLINSINEIFEQDARYKGNFALIIEKMRTASTSPTFPNGKTILSEYSVEELKKLEESIK